MLVRDEYMFTDAQKRAIEEIDQQIFALQLKKAAIMTVTPIRCKFELDRDDEIDGRINWERFNPLLGQPFIREEGVVKIKLYKKEERSDDLC